jgi:GNAT superfamily N-acetyltransferase
LPPPPELRVRRGRPQDRVPLERIFVAAGRQAWSHILGPAALEALSPPERWLDALGRGEVRVAETAGEVVGFSIATGSEVDGFYTHPSVWGRGVGRSLMCETLQGIAAAGHPRAYLWTAEENHRPRRFYERDGWEPEGAHRKRDLRGSTFVELRYRKALR